MSTAALDQRMAALQQANRIRAERARLKAHWKRTGREARWELAALVLEPSNEVLTWAVDEALLAVPGIGVAKAKRVLLSCGIPLGKPLGALSDRQALALANWLEGK